MREWGNDQGRENRKINLLFIGFGMLSTGLVLGLLWGFSIGVEHVTP